MIEEVFPGIFRMEIPLPANPLKAINSYVIKGEGRDLIVDTGMNRKECMAAMEAGLKELQVDLHKTDFFITHIHADHLGLVSQLVRDSTKVYFNSREAKLIQDPSIWDRQMASMVQNGFPESDVQNAVKRHPGHKYHLSNPLTYTIRKEGDEIQIGKFSFRCLETPGHSGGHICLYEPRTKILFSGDHILESITPNIGLVLEVENPLQRYIESLDKINAYEVTKVLPGHRQPFQDHRKRIAELKKHHETRANEVISILRHGTQSGYEVASQMTWDINYDTWEEFPLPQRWFATSEAVSHLVYLASKGRIKKEVSAERILFTLNS
jgi:glyoxylase-like metal-dependent hydrolase (beta-lactamase superfamily II)